MLKTSQFLGVVGLTCCTITLLSCLECNPWIAALFFGVEAFYLFSLSAPTSAKFKSLFFIGGLSLLAWF